MRISSPAIRPGGDAARVGRLAGRAALATLGLLVAWMCARTRGWGVAQDAANQLYVAWLMSNGATLYRDIFEINWPGNFFVHRGLLVVFGDGDRTWWWLNAALVLAVAAMVAALLRRAGPMAAALGAILVAAAHVCAGPLNLLQRDQMVGAAVLLATLAAQRGRAGVILAGAVVGLAATIKPFAFAFLPLVPLLAARRPGARAIARAAVATALGAGAALIAVFGALHLAGGLGDFVETQFRFVLPFYGEADPRKEMSLVVLRGLGPYMPLAPLLPLVAYGLAARPDAPLRPAWLAAVAVAAYGIVHAVAQGKGFGYHALPLIYGLILATGLGAERALRRTAGSWLVATGLAATAALWWTLFDGLTTRAYRGEVTTAIVDDLAPVLRPGDTVQPLDTVSGAINALRILRVPPPGRHIYDFPFFLGPPGDAFVAGLRREFVAALEARRPRAIVVTSEQWPSPRRGYERWSEWPEFAALLARDYRLAIDRALDSGWGYRIYLRRED